MMCTVIPQARMQLLNIRWPYHSDIFQMLQLPSDFLDARVEFETWHVDTMAIVTGVNNQLGALGAKCSHIKHEWGTDRAAIDQSDETLEAFKVMPNEDRTKQLRIFFDDIMKKDHKDMHSSSEYYEFDMRNLRSLIRLKLID